MIIVDIETTGLDVSTHGLLSIGAIDMRAPSRRFYQEARMHEDDAYDPESTKVNGFDLAAARDQSKQSRSSLLRNFADWFDSRQVKVVGGLHIQAFDVPFLNHKAEQSRVSLKLKKRTIDLHTLAYANMSKRKKIVPLTDGWSVMDTDVIFPYCGLPKQSPPHHALKDAMWEAEAMYRLMHGKKLLKQFDNYAVPSYLRK